jgi:hypothetical protein
MLPAILLLFRMRCILMRIAILQRSIIRLTGIESKLDSAVDVKYPMQSESKKFRVIVRGGTQACVILRIAHFLYN